MNLNFEKVSRKFEKREGFSQKRESKTEFEKVSQKTRNRWSNSRNRWLPAINLDEEDKVGWRSDFEDGHNCLQLQRSAEGVLVSTNLQ